MAVKKTYVKVISGKGNDDIYHTERTLYIEIINKAHQWCHANAKGWISFNPYTSRGDCEIFQFDCPEDATAFKLFLGVSS